MPLSVSIARHIPGFRNFHTTMQTVTLLRLVAVVALASTVGCASGKKDLKAKDAAPSAFLIHPGLMHTDRGRAPFNEVWVNPAMNAQVGATRPSTLRRSAPSISAR